MSPLARRVSGALLPALVFGAAACSPLPHTGAAAQSPLLSLPSSTTGKIKVSPPDGAVDVVPDHAVVVRAATADVKITGATLTPDGGDPVSLRAESGFFALQQTLKPDTKYTVAAVLQTGSGATAAQEPATSTFSTVTTPKVTGTTPQQIGDGQSITVSFDQPAKSIAVDGPVQATLAPDGATATVVPQTYAQGQTFKFNLTTKSLKGYSSQPQAVSFTTLGPATASTYPADGSTNDGVGIPLTLTLSAAPADKNDFASHLSVTATITPAAAPAPMANATPNALQTCAQAKYAVAQAATGPVAVEAQWLTATKVELVPKSADGYWPPASTITLNANVHGLKTQAGNWIEKDFTAAFQTADKRVIDVNLTTQDLVACKNGVPVNEFLIATGIPMFATRVGTFSIFYRVADEHMRNPDEGPGGPYWYDLQHVPWTQYFDQGRALHGAWWHNDFGHAHSHGCVNVSDPAFNTRWPSAPAQAHWLWDFDYLGDPVIVHGVTPGLTAATQPVA